MSNSDPITENSIVQTVSGARMLPEESVRGLQERFEAVVQAEERLGLVESLINVGVGLPAIENYHRKQS